MHPILAILFLSHLVLANSSGQQPVKLPGPNSTLVTSVFYSGPALSEAPATPPPRDTQASRLRDENEAHAPNNGAHSVEKRDLNERIRHMAHEQQQLAAAAAAAANGTQHIAGCQSCRKVHMSLQQATLEHIKGYMLARLGFVSGPPKPRDSWPAVPPYIWESFLTSQSEQNPGTMDEWDEERLNHQNQQKYLDSFPGTAVDQDYVGDEPSWSSRTAGSPQADEGPKVKTTRIYLFPNSEYCCFHAV